MKAELLSAGDAPIIGLEDLSEGLRSVHTHWSRLEPLVKLGELCWRLDAAGLQRQLAFLAVAAPEPRVRRVNDESAVPARVAWAALEPLSAAQAEAVATLPPEEVDELCDGAPLGPLLERRRRGRRQAKRSQVELLQSDEMVLQLVAGGAPPRRTRQRQ